MTEIEAKLLEKLEELATDSEVDMYSVANLNFFFEESANTIRKLNEEIQQYREIGTVEEFKALKEKENRFDRNIKMFNEIGLEIRNNAIDKFAEEIVFGIYESVIWDMLATMSKNGSLSDTSDKIVDYVIKTSKKIAEQMKGEQL